MQKPFIILFSIFCIFTLSARAMADSYTMKKTIMIDLDGVLNNYTKYDPDNIPNIKEGAKEFLETLYNSDKYKLVLFTARSPEQALFWLRENNIDKYFEDVTNVKNLPISTLTTELCALRATTPKP